MADIYFNGTVVPGDTYFNTSNVCDTGSVHFNGTDLGNCDTDPIPVPITDFDATDSLTGIITITFTDPTP